MFKKYIYQYDTYTNVSFLTFIKNSCSHTLWIPSHTKKKRSFFEETRSWWNSKSLKYVFKSMDDSMYRSKIFSYKLYYHRIKHNEENISLQKKFFYYYHNIHTCVNHFLVTMKKNTNKLSQNKCYFKIFCKYYKHYNI